MPSSSVPWRSGRCLHDWSSHHRCRSTANANTGANSTAASRSGHAARSSCSPGHGKWGAPICRSELRPVGTREVKELIPTSLYATTKRDHEEMGLVTGAAYGIPTVALRTTCTDLGRHSRTPIPGWRQSRLTSAQRPATGDLRGRRPVTRLHARLRHHGRHPAGAWLPRGAVSRDKPRNRKSDDGRRGRGRALVRHGGAHPTKCGTTTTVRATSDTTFADPHTRRRAARIRGDGWFRGRDGGALGLAA
jgi:hypothetical protein